MELIINIDETRFKEVLDKELEAFSKEELHNILREAMFKHLESGEVFKRILIDKEHRWGDRYEEVPSSLLKESIKNIDLQDELKDLTDKMLSDLRENHKEILDKLLLNLIVSGITDQYSFKDKVQQAVFEIMSRQN